MIGEKIKKLRKMNGLTQADIARELGITRSSVNAWEMGVSMPSTSYVIKLSRIFKVSAVSGCLTTSMLLSYQLP